LKIESLSGDILPIGVTDLAAQFLLFDDRNFIAQARFLGLDLKRDFRHSDLSGVDFTDCDLRGYDFSGSDLRGATGVDVKWDGSTVLANAQIDDSLFEYEVTKRRFFEANASSSREVSSLSRAF